MAAETIITNAFLALERKAWPSVWCSLNRFEWPAELIGYIPHNWEQSSCQDRMKCPEAATLWRLTSEHTTHKERLREWNRESMTDEEFEEWWHLRQKRFRQPSAEI